MWNVRREKKFYPISASPMGKMTVSLFFLFQRKMDGDTVLEEEIIELEEVHDEENTEIVYIVDDEMEQVCIMSSFPARLRNFRS
jgi:hypothetical protein